MATLASTGSRALRASRFPLRSLTTTKRCASSFQYQNEEQAGLRFATRDVPSETTTLAVVSRAGSRYGSVPGVANALAGFAFKSTSKRSSLRITRESELLGGQLSATLDREGLVLTARFLRQDLPYYAELLAEVISQTRYTSHELAEEVIPTLDLERKALLASPLGLALNSVHGLAYHRGLGAALAPTSTTFTTYLDAKTIADYADAAFARSNIALVANGAQHSEVSKWVKEFFGDASSSSSPVKIESQASKYYGGEERIAHGSGNALILGFPGSPAFTAGSGFKPEVSVLAALLGGESAIKWSPGFSILANAAADTPGANVNTSHAAYSDAGLLYVTLTGKASDITKAATNVVSAIKKIASGDVSDEVVKKAVSSAKFRALEAGEQTATGIETTGTGLIAGGKTLQFDALAKALEGVGKDKVVQAAKALTDNKASVSAVGDLYALPFAEEIGLKV